MTFRRRINEKADTFICFKWRAGDSHSCVADVRGQAG